MFVGRHIYPSLIFAGKAGACMTFLWLHYNGMRLSLPLKYQARAIVTDSDKHPSLLPYGIHSDHKKSYDTELSDLSDIFKKSAI